MPKPSEALLRRIARKHLDIETLQVRNSDALDSHNVAVWSIRSALVAAYRAGAKECPAKPADFISIGWSVEDVQEMRPDLSAQQCREVLREVARRHDATIGITWDTIAFVADILYPE